MEDKICSNIQEFNNFLHLQAEEMKKYKWIESERVGHDLGNNALSEWIKKYAKDFREQYLQSH